MPKIDELFDLTGEYALVTGGTTGLGYAMAEALAEAGANLAICGRGKHGSLDEALSTLSQIGPEVVAFKCDVSLEEDISNLVQQLQEIDFKVSVLINNAGISWGEDSHTVPLEKFNMVIDVNLTGLFLLTTKILNEFMIPQTKGSIINITSVAAYVGGEVGVAAYSASKSGLIGMTKQLAVEFAPYNIRCNAIAPSWFPSYMSRHFTSTESPFRQILVDQNPMRRLGDPWEVKGATVFLASKAASYISGQVLAIDGGLLSKL